MEWALQRHGVRPSFGPGTVCCVNVCAQVHTVVFATVFSVWSEAGYVKVNLHPDGWRKGEADARRFFAELAPAFLTGDPVGFAEMMRWELPVRPAALVSTALELGAGLKRRFELRYGCPVIDWYSTTETGPLAYSCPVGEGMHLLPPDVHVEVVDEEGFPLGPGERGELTVTGGRNPFLPLLRYRTGDFGRLETGPCGCGDPAPRIVDFVGRDPVSFRAADGTIVNPVDIGRILRPCVFVQHEFVQRRDGSCQLSIRPAPGGAPDLGELRRRLESLLGRATPLEIVLDEGLGVRAASGKTFPYRSELPLLP